MDKVFHFFIAQKIVFAKEDKEKVKNADGSFSTVPSLGVKSLLAAQLKTTIRKRESYGKSREVEVLSDDGDGEEDEDKKLKLEKSDTKLKPPKEAIDDPEEIQRLKEAFFNAEDEEEDEMCPESSNSTTTPRSSPRKKKRGSVVPETSSVPPAKKVIITEQHPNFELPNRIYTFSFFNQVRQNSLLAQAVIVKKKEEKTLKYSSYSKSSDDDTSSTDKSSK